MASEKKFDVFLSHNSKDKPWAIKLKETLEALGIKVWLDKDEIRPGDLFARALEKGIEESRAVAVIISPESMSSNWVEAEYYRALTLTTNHQLQLIPILYKMAVIPGFLSDRSWIDFRDEKDYEDNLGRLIWGITGKKPENIFPSGIRSVKVEVQKTPNDSSPAELRKKMDERYDLESLLVLCHDLGVRYENLPSRGISAKIVDLIEHCKRHNKYELLVRKVLESES